WRGRFTLLPAFTLQDRVIEVCQQSEAPSGAFSFLGYGEYTKFIAQGFIQQHIVLSTLVM
ncbi:hypothetical protein, partial [Yersinia enterocolitica]|uniref:hypothetical protein n=1 Tax=Yersinia enterocolitica TaxID=630 RepID=UPI000B2A09EF